jgi:NAD-dependent SIR2 family protein deacetylase
MRIAQVQPNHTHLRVAQWEAKQERWFAGLITQNVDGLHFAAGGHKVIELHGSLSSTSCIECKAKESRDAFQNRLAESNSDFKALGEHLQKELLMRPDGDMNLLNQSGLDIDRFRIPRCLACGARESIRPDVVFFGENVDRDLVDKCYALVDQSDLLLVLGSSLQVFSAYRFVKFAHEKNKKICIVNVGPTRADALAHLKIEGYCSYVLQHVDPFDSTT